MEGFIYESPLIFRYALRKFFQNFLCDRKGIELFHRRRKDVSYLCIHIMAPVTSKLLHLMGSRLKPLIADLTHLSKQ